MTGNELRAEAVRRAIPLYRLATELGYHPSYFDRLLRQDPVPDDLTRRAMEALGKLEHAR